MATVKKLTAQQRAKVNDAVAKWLELASQIQELKKQQEKLMSEVIEPFAETYKHEFADNKFELEAGYLIWATGRAKLVTSEGKSVNKEVKKLLVKRLPAEVIKQDVDLSALEKALEEGDPLVSKALEEYELELVRMPSLQVKPYKAKKAA